MKNQFDYAEEKGPTDHKTVSRLSTIALFEYFWRAMVIGKKHNLRLRTSTWIYTNLYNQSSDVTPT